MLTIETKELGISLELKRKDGIMVNIIKEEILDNLKSKSFVKSKLVMKVVDRDKMIAFIKLVDKTITEYKSISELTVL